MMILLTALTFYSMHFNTFRLHIQQQPLNLSMLKKNLYICIIFSVLMLFHKSGTAQQNSQKTDTFFLAKKKGLLGRFGKSISTTPPDEAPVKVVNPFLKFRGKIIRSIETIRLGFEYDINDTTELKENFGVRVGRRFHKNTTDNVIKNNLFFKEGSRLFPYLLADNERYLRDLSYIKDARILVDFSEGSTDSVDVVVLTKDVFSIGLNFSISSKDKGRIALREENLMGSGNQILISGYHENPRSPQNAFGAELLKRNIKGSFLDWTIDSVWI